MKLGARSRITADDVIDGQATAVVALDDSLCVSILNLAAEGIFEVSRRLALGDPLIEAIPHFVPHELRLRKALDSMTGFIERELKLTRSGSVPVTVDLTVTPFVVGRKPGLLLEMQAVDRHQRIARDGTLQTQFDTSRELIRGLAHEIKNPLGGIRGAAQLMEHEFPDSQHREYTRVIIREVDRLQNLVNRMLGPNRAPDKALINIHEVLEHVRQLVQAEAPAEVRVLRDYDPSIPEVTIDREQIIQAVLNVLRNALHAVGGHGAITLRTRTRRQLTVGGARHKLMVQIDIEDDGCGVPPEMIEKIFYPMVTTRADGTGLGLPLSQYLVHSHGGLIECRSRPGCTVFSIFLPIEVT